MQYIGITLSLWQIFKICSNASDTAMDMVENILKTQKIKNRPRRTSSECKLKQLSHSKFSQIRVVEATKCTTKSGSLKWRLWRGICYYWQPAELAGIAHPHKASCTTPPQNVEQFSLNICTPKFNDTILYTLFN